MRPLALYLRRDPIIVLPFFKSASACLRLKYRDRFTRVTACYIAVLAIGLSVCLSVCLSLAVVVSKRLQTVPSTLCYKKLGISKIKVLLHLVATVRRLRHSDVNSKPTMGVMQRVARIRVRQLRMFIMYCALIIITIALGFKGTRTTGWMVGWV